MKKTVIFSLFVTLAIPSFSQSLDEIGEMMNKKQYVEAKAAIDKHLLDTKNAAKADGWFYKGRIYNTVSRLATTAKPDALSQKTASFEAFQKYQKLADKNELKMIGENYISYLDLYLGAYDLGANQYNEKEYQIAYNAFSKAQEIENFILDKNYTYTEMKLYRLDTSLLMNTCAAALKIGDTATAIKGYNRLVEANVSGEGYEEIYEFLAKYYNSKKDNANLNSILAKGKKLYPKSNFWSEVELLILTEKGDRAALLAKYDELYKSDPSNFFTGYNYSVELYTSLYGKDVTKVDVDVANKLTQVLKTTIAVDTSNEANMLMTNHLYNFAADYSIKAASIKEGKVPKPDDAKKKKELATLANAKMDELIPYAETCIKYYGSKTNLKTRAKINYELAAGYLVEVYKIKANLKKVAEYEKLRKSIQL
jgi:hypothetical protein